MKISINWLRTYIDFDCSIEDLAEKLTMVGLEVEETRTIEPFFSNVVVGKVLKVEKHPDADKLTVCLVDVGTGELSIVCGAPNVTSGILVPVAKEGGHVGELRIKKVTLRGVQSSGMICSERELGLSNDHSGILVLPDSGYDCGRLFLPELQETDTLFEVNITPNRPDCMSHLGIARELGVILKKPLNIPKIAIHESSEKVEKHASVEIQDPEACPRYSARVIRNISIGPSPRWLQARLNTVGIRSINNVVDITNFVLMETGHPLHAFDYDRIGEKRIRVRKAAHHEHFITLDDKEHRLEDGDLLICDGNQPVALAGIMGGQNSEISTNSSNVLLESAYFHPPGIRRTAKRLGMSTEASIRFERGADPNGTVYALNRAAQLMAELAGGEICKGIIDIYPNPIHPRKILLRPKRVSHVLGMEIPVKDMITILKGLDLQNQNEGNSISVTAPTFRPDLINEIDLIEEVVRHYGYDQIPANDHAEISLKNRPDTEYLCSEAVRDILSGIGFMEVWSNSLVSRRHIQDLTPEIEPVTIRNPLSPDTQYLRTTLLANILDNLLYNINRGERNLMLFETGNTFRMENQRISAEKLKVAGGITGMTTPGPFWHSKAEAFDLYHLKGIIDHFLIRMNAKNIRFIPSQNPIFGDQCIEILGGEILIGTIGEIQPQILKCWDIPCRVFGFELDFKNVFQIIPEACKYQPIPRYPSIKRDLAMVVDHEIPSAEMTEWIYKTGGSLVSKVEIFDVYQGESLKQDKKSIGFSLTFLSMDRTLREDEINPVFEKIIQSLCSQFHAALRS